MTTDNDRLVAMETALAHQDMKIQDLSDVVDRQWKDIERLTRRLDRMVDRLDGMDSAAESGDAQSVADIAAANKPPHY